MKSWDGFQFMFIETVKDMEKIVKMNGYVYLVIEHDVYGRHTTFKNLGKDPDDPMWADELNGTKPNKKKNKKETD